MNKDNIITTTYEKKQTNIKKFEIGIVNFHEQILDNDNGNGGRFKKIIFDLELQEKIKNNKNVEEHILPILNKYVDYIQFVNRFKIVIDVQSYCNDLSKIALNKIIHAVASINSTLQKLINDAIIDTHDYYLQYLQLYTTENENENENVIINMEHMTKIHILLKKWIMLKKIVDKQVNEFFDAIKFLDFSNLNERVVNKIIKKINLIINLVNEHVEILKIEYNNL